MKSSCDLKEPLSANSKSSGSDDVKPLSHRKAKNQKANSKTSEVSEISPPEEPVQNGEKVDTEDKFEDAMEIKTEDKCDVTDTKTDEKYDVTMVKNEEKYDVIKMEPEAEPMKVEESNTTTTKPQNILEEAVKIIFDEPAPDLIVPTAGIFSRMTSQAMLAASHPPAYKYVGYEAMDETVNEYNEKTGTSGETQELDVTVKGWFNVSLAILFISFLFISLVLHLSIISLYLSIIHLHLGKMTNLTNRIFKY